jgi:3-hydroxyisobutyrate dehydrogenase-like beta-hydroxyacid dehydrogenase
VLTGSDVVLSLVGASAAVTVAEQVLPRMEVDAVFADLNTSSPEVKAEVARRADSRGVPMADVAVMAPVPRAGHRTPLLASGSGAERFAVLLTELGAPVEVVGSEPGDAAKLKLLRSVFMKGLAALVIESLGAARATGAEEWMRSQIAGELGPEGGALVDRLVEGTYAHAQRRAHEVAAALAELDAGGQPSDMTRATLAWFDRIIGSSSKL